MDSVANYFSSDSEEEYPAKCRYRQLRDNSNVFELPEKRFIKLFRLSKNAFKYVLGEIDSELNSKSRSSSIPNVLKVAAVLRFLSEGSYQQGVGQEYLIGMSQSTISVTLKEVISILLRKVCNKWISFRQTETQRQECMNFFFEKFRFPGVIGCVDGTHIKIIRPVENEHHYFNRKGFHSINTMIACDHNMRILSIDPRYGGASHDSAVWRLSQYRPYLQEQRNNSINNCWILGDSGYPLEMWLITPFRSAQDGSREATFNSIHAKARSTIERCIGLLKQRFRCLLGARELHYHPEMAAQIVNACAALHNICIFFKVPLEIEIEEGLAINADFEADINQNSPENDRAKQLRNNVLNSII